MARNENTGHPNRHTLYVGCSGSGKSQCLKQNKTIPKKGARVLLWDTNNDHKANRFAGQSVFKKALVDAIRKGAGFRLAYDSKAASVDEFEWFCGLVWQSLDGNYDTYVIIEELAGVTETVSKASPNLALLLNQGRKYGAILHMTTQRCTEISKTAYQQAEGLYVGVQKGLDNEKMAKRLGCHTSDVLELQALREKNGLINFLYNDGTPDVTLHSFKYEK